MKNAETINFRLSPHELSAVFILFFSSFSFLFQLFDTENIRIC